jgi:hypothetical protein
LVEVFHQKERILKNLGWGALLGTRGNAADSEVPMAQLLRDGVGGGSRRSLITLGNELPHRILVDLYSTDRYHKQEKTEWEDDQPEKLEVQAG